MEKCTRIIIIDASVDRLLLSKFILERKGYEVLILGNTIDLFGYIERFEPALIFVSSELPRVKGLGAARLIKAEVRWKHIPIVYLSRVDEVVDMAGAEDSLRIPFHGEELIKMAEKYI